jgi:small-conductance mechanosensitive channel
VALQKQINTLVKDYRKKAFTKESEYLWEGISHDSLHRSLRSIISESYTRNKKVFISYITQSWNKYILLLPVFLFFFFWPLLNIQKIRKRNQEFMENLLYIRRMPLLSALAIILLLAPYLDLQHPPAVFNIFIQFLLLLVISMILFRKWPGGLFRYWIFFLLAFLFFAGKSLLSGSTYYLRVFTFVITIFYAGLGIRFIRETRTQNKYFPQFFPAIIGLFILLNLSASGCNLLGRATFAHILETTAILNFLEAMSLIICIQLLLDAVNLQLEADKKSSRFTAYLNYQNVALRLRRLLTVTAGIFWFINLAQNLNVFDSAYDAIAGFLESERSVGNTSFTIGSIVIFFFVIWVANFFQKYIGYFFGDTGADDLMPEKKSKIGTSILLVRLLILTSGFFLGILASGIPLDKVTIIIGALGVGIGLGLQNIVNNLVSGVILAVERPIQVGDLIEVGSSIGRVKEIGIRSCRIITEEGAEVIIPNGDVLSQKLTNWTLNNTHMRVDATLKLADSSQLEKAKEIIIKVLQSTKGVLQTPEPQILYKNISQAGAEMQILFWADDINRYVQLKSEILRNIYEECSKEGITIA